MMKKTLIFVDAIDALAINEAIKKQTEGFEIYLLGCDGTEVSVDTTIIPINGYVGIVTARCIKS